MNAEVFFAFNDLDEPGFDVCDIRCGVEFTCLLLNIKCCSSSYSFFVEFRYYLLKEFMGSAVANARCGCTKPSQHILIARINCWSAQVLRALPAETLVDGLPRAPIYF